MIRDVLGVHDNIIQLDEGRMLPDLDHDDVSGSLERFRSVINNVRHPLEPVEAEVRSEGVLVPIVRIDLYLPCLLYTSPSPRDKRQSRMPSSA